MRIEKLLKSTIIVFVLMLSFVTNNVNATNYQTVDSFPKQISPVYWGSLYNYNGPNIPFKWQAGSQNIAVYCTMFQKSLYGGPCMLKSDDWSEQVKAGVASIIKEADASNTEMSYNYYYAEEAMNLFLYHYADGSYYHLPNNNAGIESLGTYKKYYNNAVTAYNKVSTAQNDKSSIAKIKQVSGANSYNKRDSDLTGDYNIYRVTGSGDDGTFDIYYQISGTLPDGVKVELKSDSTGGNKSVTNAGEKISGLKNGSNFYINITGITDNSEAMGKSFKIIIKSSATISYDIAENYDCGSTVQSYTPNMIKTTSLKGTDQLTLTITTENSPEYPKLKVLKTNETNNPLANATFRLIKDGDEDDYVDYDTDESGIVEFNELLEGRYCLTEENAPEGYALNSEERCFKVDLDDDNKAVVTLENSNLSYDKNTYTISTTYVNSSTSLKVSKVDQNGNYVAGATLKLVKFTDIVLYSNLKDAPAVELNGEKLEWKSGTEPKVITGLPAGFYFLVEVSAPNGYILSNLEEVVWVSPKKETTVNFVNEELSVTISKKDITTKEELPGATLRILDTDGNVVSDIFTGEKLVWVSTDEAKVIKGLIPGTYDLEETQAPEGYALMTEKIRFTLNEDGTIVIENSTEDESVVIMTNAHTKVYISKQDITTKEELPGATLQLLNENGKVIDEWISTTEPHYIEGLPSNNTYTLIEITSPDGYSLNTESVTFTINADGTITGDTVMYNTPIPDVPNTLSTKSILITICGVSIIGLGLGFYINGFKKQKQN